MGEWDGKRLHFISRHSIRFSGACSQAIAPDLSVAAKKRLIQTVILSIPALARYFAWPTLYLPSVWSFLHRLGSPGEWPHALKIPPLREDKGGCHDENKMIPYFHRHHFEPSSWSPALWVSGEALKDSFNSNGAFCTYLFCIHSVRLTVARWNRSANVPGSSFLFLKMKRNGTKEKSRQNNASVRNACAGPLFCPAIALFTICMVLFAQAGISRRMAARSKNSSLEGGQRRVS